MASYRDMLTQPATAPSRRQELLRLAMEILTLSLIDEEDDSGFAQKDGTGPEIYVAPRYSPAP